MEEEYVGLYSIQQHRINKSTKKKINKPPYGHTLALHN